MTCILATDLEIVLCAGGLGNSPTWLRPSISIVHQRTWGESSSPTLQVIGPETPVPEVDLVGSGNQQKLSRGVESQGGNGIVAICEPAFTATL